MKSNSWRQIGVFLVFALPVAVVLAQTAPPVAPVRDQVDLWHGEVVHDPYRYMENLADPQVQSWLGAQGAWLGDAPAQARAVFGPTINRDLGLQRLDNGRLLFTPGSPWVIAATNDTTQAEGSVFVARVEDLAAGHGIGSTPAQGRSVSADSYSFLLWQMDKRRLEAGP